MRAGMPGGPQMMKKLREMQEKMAEAQEQLGEKKVVGCAGGGAMEVTVNGHKEVVQVKIAQEFLESMDLQEPAMLEDLLISACNDALRKADEMAREDMEKVTKGMPLPPGLL